MFTIPIPAFTMSVLTMLGIVVGVAAVITMVTLGSGATRLVSNQIASFGSNLLMVVPGQRLKPRAGGAPSFKGADAEVIRSQIGSLEAVAPVTNRAVTTVYGAQNWSTLATGSTEDYFTAGNWKLAAGRTFNDAEQRAGKAVCVIGETVRRKLLHQQSPVGAEICLKGFACPVIGLLAKGQSAMGTDQDDVVVMPLRTVQRRLTGSQGVTAVLVSVKAGASIDRAKAEIAALCASDATSPRTRTTIFSSTRDRSPRCSPERRAC